MTGICTKDNNLVETGVFVSVTAELVDRRTGEIVVPARERHVWSGYALGEQAAQNEVEALERALTHVAETLVLDLFGPASSRESTPGAGVGDSNTAGAGTL